MNESEVENFFNALPDHQPKELADVFDDKPVAPKEEPTVPAMGAEEGNDDIYPGNRKFRRLQEQLTAERESNIALAERIKVLAEVSEEKKFRDQISEKEQIDPDLLQAFGDNEIGQKLAKIFEKKLANTVSLAEERALERIAREQEEIQNISSQGIQQAENEIDWNLDNLGHKYGIDFNAPGSENLRNRILDGVEAASPKDAEGNITEYANFDYVYSTMAPRANNNRQKEIASRSMQRSGSSNSAPKEITPGFRGWMKDYNI